MPDTSRKTAPLSVDADKAAFRNRMRALRRSQSREAAREKSDAAQRRLLFSGLWREAGSVALFAALQDEISTNALLEEAWQAGRQVYLPRVCPGNAGQMEFVRCAGFDQLRTGRFGLREPLVSLPGFGPEDSGSAFTPDILVMPGLAFDRQGGRLGYGAGYYDRFLQNGLNCPRIGLCFAFQIVGRLPQTAWDMPVHYICTEEELSCL